MKINTLFLKTTILITVLVFSCEKPIRDLHPETLVGGFELLPPERTGIDFNNTIKESTYFNHYYYSHIYNGSGVAIGDINNDGLSDIFFGGNQVSDRLFLNKGNFKFENITKNSRAAKNTGWTWGVTMADVNADGYLDIYVSRNGNSLKLEDCRNQLYINNQDLTFTESAIAYGLADVGFSTQAVFFDMDNDGDLDMYQVNQPPDKKLLLVSKIPQEHLKFYKDRLYRNDNGRYKDVSDKSGISGDMAYGLSVNATDFNNDGLIDLYISNDYNEPDFLYYNNGDGTFQNKSKDNLKHMSQYSMGSDTADVCDLDELKNGMPRKEGTFGAIYWLMVKIGQSIALILGGLILSIVGFDPNVTEQSLETMNNLRIADIIVPSATAALAVWVMWKYDLTEKRAIEIKDALIERRGEL